MKRIFYVQENNSMMTILFFLLMFFIGFIFSNIYLNNKIYRDCVEKGQYTNEDFKLECKLINSDY